MLINFLRFPAVHRKRVVQKRRAELSIRTIASFERSIVIRDFKRWPYIKIEYQKETPSKEIKEETCRPHERYHVSCATRRLRGACYIGPMHGGSHKSKHAIVSRMALAPEIRSMSMAFVARVDLSLRFDI